MIEFRKVSLAYDGLQILSDLNCTFGRHEFTCIIGKNGSGKSTLLRAAAGLAPYSGNLRLDGVEICRVPRQERAKRLSYLPQTRPIPAMNVETLIAHGRYPHLGFSQTLTAADREQIANAASVTGISNLLYRSLSSLSGGERQRAYIAMMAAQDADIVLLDEPTTHLDIEHQLEVMELLQKLHKNGKGTVMAAHDLPQAFSCATHVLLIAGGSIAASGTPDELCRNPATSSALSVAIRKTNETDELYSYRVTKGVAPNGRKRGA